MSNFLSNSVKSYSSLRASINIVFSRLHRICRSTPRSFFSSSLAFFNKSCSSFKSRISRCSSWICFSSSSRFESAWEPLSCFMDAASSFPNNCFFQLYRVTRSTSSFSANTWALSFLVQSSKTAARLKASEAASLRTLPTTRCFASGYSSQTQSESFWREG